MPQTLPVARVLAQAAAGEVAPGHALDREHLEPLADDRAAGVLLGDVGGHHVVVRVAEPVEPPQAHPGEDLPLVRDRRARGRSRRR